MKTLLSNGAKGVNLWLSLHPSLVYMVAEKEAQHIYITSTSVLSVINDQPSWVDEMLLANYVIFWVPCNNLHHLDLLYNLKMLHHHVLYIVRSYE